MLTMDTAVVKLTETLDNLNDMFSTQNKRNLTLALSNLKNTLEGFEELSKTLNSF